MFNKKGQGLSTNTIILLVLGVIVLVVLAYGFMSGFAFFTQPNVDEVVENCKLACEFGKQYDFCGVERNLRAEDNFEVKTSCYVLANLAEFNKFGVNECAPISCEITSCEDIQIDDISADVEGKTGSYDVSSLCR